MPVQSGDVTITVTYSDGSVEVFVVLAANAAAIVKGDILIKFKGKKTSGTPETTDTDQEITRANTRKVKYEVAP